MLSRPVPCSFPARDGSKSRAHFLQRVKLGSICFQVRGGAEYCGRGRASHGGGPAQAVCLIPTPQAISTVPSSEALPVGLFSAPARTTLGLARQFTGRVRWQTSALFPGRVPKRTQRFLALLKTARAKTFGSPTSLTLLGNGAQLEKQTRETSPPIGWGRP